MLISACSLVLAILWSSIWALAVVGGGVGEGSGAEKPLDREPDVLTTDELAKVALLLGKNHATTTLRDYASRMSKYKVSS